MTLPALRAAARRLAVAGLAGLAVATAFDAVVPQDAAPWGAPALLLATLLGVGALDVVWGLRARWLDVVAVNVVLTLVLTEALLTVWSRVQPSMLTLDAVSVVHHIQAARLPPGSLYFGSPLNSGGYHDEEFFASRPDDLVVALLGDSFAYGIVPLEQNFVTRAERELAGRLAGRFARVAIHNFGIPSIDVPEYAYLLEHEALPYRPARVVLAIFVGNDIARSRIDPPRRPYSLLDWLAVRVPWRAWLWAREAARGGTLLDPGASDGAPGEVRGPEPGVPTFSRERFLAIEAQRIGVLDAGRARTRRQYAAFFEALRYFEDRLGDRLIVLLLPDEFQVDDTLYAEVATLYPHAERLDRTYPQDQIRAFCERNGIALVDVLEPLRAELTRGPVFQPRDTHLNARGNAVVASALAEALLAGLAPRHESPTPTAQLQSTIAP